MSSHVEAMPNRLANEPSPYLLQHANNPVDWYPWSEEAFAKARSEEKPIFLSVGYSTCHWCHVMEHESFEHADIAAVLNEHFVSIKVDREERPDVDRVYMTFVQATTGAGGWPMSVWLTPELKPFYGGTYFPPSSRWGRPGFVDILRDVARRWANDRAQLLESADTILERLGRAQRPGATDGVAQPVAGADALAEGVEQFAQAFDERHGGFGNAPKFPRPSELLFLLRESARAANPRARHLAVETLRAMARGGVRDHIGGGFHRYSVDAAWRVPHFEKMLYDQAQLVLAYLEAGQATGDRFFLDVAADTLEYVLRDMTSADGGFYSAEDADSVPPEQASDAGAQKTEGAFYLWTDAELDDVLGSAAGIAKRRFGVEPDGNAPQDPMGELRGKNILYLQQEIDEIARLTDRPVDAVAQTLATVRQRLFETRERRPRPHLDDKVLAAWNGLMIAALARAAHVLDDPAAGRFLAAARRAATFAHDRLWDPDRRVLYRRYRDGQFSIEGYSEDYAFLVWGLVELFQVEGDVTWLDWALELQTRQDELFWDETEGGWYSTTGRDPSVLLRLKEDYDGAEPSSSSVSVSNVLTLMHVTGDAHAVRKVELTLGRFGHRLGQAARVVPMMLVSLATFHAKAAQVVILGERGAEETRVLRRRVAARYLPFAVRVTVEPGSAQARLAQRLAFVGPMRLLDGHATAYVCTDFACQAPVSDPDALDAQLIALNDQPPAPSRQLPAR